MIYDDNDGIKTRHTIIQNDVMCNVFCNVARNIVFFNDSIKKLNGLLSLTLNELIDSLKTVCNVMSHGLS